MSAELALAIIATADLCLKYGNEFKQLYAALKNAETEIHERIIRLDYAWSRCVTQLNFLKKMQRLMNEDLLIQHEQTLHVLVGKLEIVKAILQRLVRGEVREEHGVSMTVLTPKRLDYAFKKKSLDRAIETFETWQRISDPSWFLMLRIADRQLDAELGLRDDSIETYVPSALVIRHGVREDQALNQSSSMSSMSPTAALMPHTPPPGIGAVKGSHGLSLPATEFRQMTKTSIDYSSAFISSSSPSRYYILDPIAATDAYGTETVRKNIRDLCRRLQHTEPSNFGLLNCKGFVDESPSFTMVFRPPEGLSHPCSLRDYILNAKTLGSLSHQFEIARQLANSVSYVHTFGFVHKNIRPESILVFEPSFGHGAPSIFLFGFTNFRMEEGRTQRFGDDYMENNLYRHPSRQGLHPQDIYEMQHDIYSLGVCLLEIGLWKSLLQYDGEQKTPKLAATVGLEENAPRTNIMDYLQTCAKDKFLELTRSKLPGIMGDMYTEVVETCLTCLDAGNKDFGDRSEAVSCKFRFFKRPDILDAVVKPLQANVLRFRESVYWRSSK